MAGSIAVAGSMHWVPRYWITDLYQSQFTNASKRNTVFIIIPDRPVYQSTILLVWYQSGCPASRVRFPRARRSNKARVVGSPQLSWPCPTILAPWYRPCRHRDRTGIIPDFSLETGYLDSWLSRIADSQKTGSVVTSGKQKSR